MSGVLNVKKSVKSFISNQIINYNNQLHGFSNIVVKFFCNFQKIDLYYNLRPVLELRVTASGPDFGLDVVDAFVQLPVSEKADKTQNGDDEDPSAVSVVEYPRLLELFNGFCIHSYHKIIFFILLLELFNVPFGCVIICLQLVDCLKKVNQMSGEV